jgi:hypothetical protein
MTCARRRRTGSGPLGHRLVSAFALGTLFLAGCSDPVSGTAQPAVRTPVQPRSDTSTSAAPPATQVSAACPLLSAKEVSAIYLVPLTAKEEQPLSQSGATVYNCSYRNDADQQLAALQVVVDPAASGDPQQYLDGFIKPFLAEGATAQAVPGLNTPAESYVRSDPSGPIAYVVAAVREVGSTWDVVQFLASEHNAGDPNARPPSTTRATRTRSRT